MLSYIVLWGVMMRNDSEQVCISYYRQAMSNQAHCYKSLFLLEAVIARSSPRMLHARFHTFRVRSRNSVLPLSEGLLVTQDGRFKVLSTT